MYVQVTITVFNKRLGADRRDVYLPTTISGASYLEAKGSGHSSDGAHSEHLTYKLRIPVDAHVQDARTYVNEKTFRALPEEETVGHWTLQKGDIILAIETALEGPLSEAEVKQLAAGARADVITVKEYADNTIRGTARVKHWRIGGE